MGYDMVMQGELTERETQALDEARAQLQRWTDQLEAVRAGGDSELVKVAEARYDEGFAAYCRADVGYFRLNIFGMGKARELMDAAGMLLWAVPPQFPAVDEDMNEEDWGAALDPVQTWTVRDSPHLMGHKLCSNDWWLVTPGECRAVASRWQRLLRDASTPAPADMPPWWTDWMDWHARCAERGGYRVE